MRGSRGGRPGGLGFREPISKAEEGAHFPALVPVLLGFRYPRIRETERVFVVSNGVDHRVGCFHQDVFPFRFVVFEPLASFDRANCVTEKLHHSQVSYFFGGRGEAEMFRNQVL